MNQNILIIIVIISILMIISIVVALVYYYKSVKLKRTRLNKIDKGKEIDTCISIIIPEPSIETINKPEIIPTRFSGNHSNWRAPDIKLYIALWKWIPQNEDELYLNPGDLVKAIMYYEDGYVLVKKIDAFSNTIKGVGVNNLQVKGVVPLGWLGKWEQGRTYNF